MTLAGNASLSAELLPIEACGRFEAAWRALQAVSGRVPSTSYEWAMATLANHPFSRPDAFLAVVRQGSKIVALVPMVSSSERVPGRNVVTLRPLQELSNTHSDLLVDGDAGPVLGAWLAALRGGDRRWDLLRLSWVLEDWPLLSPMREALQVTGLACRWRDEQPSFQLTLPESLEAYLAARSARFRSHLKRSEKKLAAAGRVELLRVEALPGHAAYYDWLLDIERGSWKHAHGTAISAVAHQRGFYRDLCRATLDGGTLHLTFLLVAGKPVAYNLGVMCGDTYSYLKTSYRDDYRPMGAAAVARIRLIAELLQSGVRRMDFPAEPYEWERQWTDELCWHNSALVYGGTPAATAIRALHWVRTRFASQPPRSVRYQDPRALKGDASDG